MNYIKDCESLEQFKYTVTKVNDCVWEEFVKVWTNFQNFIENFDRL